MRLISAKYHHNWNVNQHNEEIFLLDDNLRKYWDHVFTNKLAKFNEAIDRTLPALT